MSPAALGLAVVFSFMTLDQWGTVATIAVVVGGIIIAIPSRRSLAVWKGNAEADKRRADGIQKDLEGAAMRAATAEAEARRCSDLVIHWKAKYDEQERYTARGALETVAERLASLEATIVSAITNQGELILKNTELASSAIKALERVIADLQALEDKIDP